VLDSHRDQVVLSNILLPHLPASLYFPCCSVFLNPIIPVFATIVLMVVRGNPMSGACQCRECIEGHWTCTTRTKYYRDCKRSVHWRSVLAWPNTKTRFGGGKPQLEIVFTNNAAQTISSLALQSFRSNIARRRNFSVPVDIRKMNFNWHALPIQVTSRVSD
jgi:hypothetical protein